MTDQEIREEVSYFTKDIWRWVNENDFRSAAQMARALSKFLNDVKGFKNEG